jgi:hypothetical protein
VATTIDRTSLLRQATEGGPVDTVPLPHVEVDAYSLERDEGRVSMRMPVPFTPRLVWGVDPQGRLWAGAPGDYRITIHDDAGRPVRVVEKPHTPVPVSAAERSALPDQVEWFVNQGGTVDLGRVPSTKPAYEDVYFDDLGYAWLRPHVADDAPGTALDVFDPEGLYVAILQCLPAIRSRCRTRREGPACEAMTRYRGRFNETCERTAGGKPALRDAIFRTRK